MDNVTILPLASIICVEEPDRSDTPSHKYASLADEMAKRCEVVDVNNNTPHGVLDVLAKSGTCPIISSKKVMMHSST